MPKVITKAIEILKIILELLKTLLEIRDSQNLTKLGLGAQLI